MISQRGIAVRYEQYIQRHRLDVAVYCVDSFMLAQHYGVARILPSSTSIPAALSRDEVRSATKKKKRKEEERKSHKFYHKGGRPTIASADPSISSPQRAPTAARDWPILVS